MIIFKKSSIWLGGLATCFILVIMVAAVMNNSSLKSADFFVNRLIAIAYFVGVALISWRLTRILIAKQKSNMVIFLVIGFLTMIKIPLLFFGKFSPISDFYGYFDFAQQISSGVTWHEMWTAGALGINILWPHVINISWLFSVPLNFFNGAFIVDQLASVLLSGLNVFLLYILLTKMFPKQLALFTALMFYFMPAYWLYSLLDAPESIFLTFFLGAILSFGNGLFVKYRILAKNYFYIAFSLILLTVANMIRPIILVWIIVIVFWGLFSIRDKQSKGLKRRGLIIMIYALAFGAFNVGSTQFYRFVYGIDIAPQTVAQSYSLAVGTNVKDGGQFNDRIAQSVVQTLRKNKDNQQRYREIKRDMTKITVQNFKDIQKVGPTNFLWRKVTHLMQESYGTDWLLYNLSSKDQSYYYKKITPIASVISVIYFEIILGITLILTACQLILIFNRKLLHTGNLNTLLLGFLMLDGFFLSSMIFEVQGRYQIVLYIPVMLLFGIGCNFIGSLIANRGLHQ